MVELRVGLLPTLNPGWNGKRSALSWLSIIYNEIGNKKKAEYFEKLAVDTITKEGEEPELYFSNSPNYNDISQELETSGRKFGFGSDPGMEATV